MADMVKRVLEKTELYLLFKKKSGDDDALRAAVKELCREGEALSSQAYTFFPTFTRHDASHILGVCDWMYKLLKSMKRGKTSALDVLTAEEAALLLLAACWHDSGMAVSEAQKKKLLASMEAHKGDWKAYFKKHPGDEVALAEAKRDEEKTREQERILRNYVRERHAKRCEKQLPDETKWSDALKKHHIYRKHVAAVCASHGANIEKLSLINSDRKFDMRLCAVLLRLADLLDYDASRAPEALFRFLGLDRPETEEQRVSREEWNKNATGGFEEIEDRTIYYHATFTDSQTKQGVKKYLDWVRGELDASQIYLDESEQKRWSDFRLPHRVEDTSVCEGIESGEFRITMDQDRVVELLSGSALYEHAGVFVRELLQNSIDAVLYRRKLDTSYVGHIVVRCWRDDEGWGWFRIEDDGVGMDEHIIKDYFLKVGHSFYDSDEYRAASLHVARETGDKPTSRFGIGILSVFMSDPDNTILQVSTRRYGEETPLRLDVTGLHGYYDLTRLTEERRGKPMSAPPYWHAPETELGRGVGTTICARVNLFRLGETSIRELLDQYVIFPEVRVTFYDETGVQKDYPTQKELMDAVHRLEGQELVCPLTPEMVERVEERTQGIFQWTKPPALTLRLHPLDTLPDEEVKQIVSGVVLEVGFCGDALEVGFHGEDKNKELSGWLSTEFVGWNNTSYEPTVTLDAEVNDELHEIALRIAVERRDTERRRLRIQREALYANDERWKRKTADSVISFSFNEIFGLLLKSSKDEWSVLQDIQDALQASQKTCDIAAFNGVAVDRTRLMGVGKCCLGVILLFRGSGRPAVNLERNAVTELSLDALSAMSLLRKSLPRLLRSATDCSYEEQYYLHPEREWFEVLEKHPKWEMWLRCDRKSLDELNGLVHQTGEYKVSIDSFKTNFVTDRLLLAALKKRFQIRKNGSDFCLQPHFTKTEPLELPLPLFLRFEETNRAFVDIRWFNLYSETHPFSQWLIAYQAELRDKTPAFYHSILKTMVLGKNRHEIRAALNDTLDRLARLPDNHFGITKDLYLTEQDFL